MVTGYKVPPLHPPTPHDFHHLVFISLTKPPLLEYGQDLKFASNQGKAAKVMGWIGVFEHNDVECIICSTGVSLSPCYWL